MGKTFEISEENLQQLLSNATKQGIELGQQMVKSKEAIPIDSPAFNAQRLFMQGRHPHLRTEIEDISTSKGIRDYRGLPVNDYSRVCESDVQCMIRKLAQSAFNATKNDQIPIGERSSALRFYDRIADEWLACAKKYIPNYRQCDHPSH